MIDLPPEFEADIQGQNLNLYPILLINAPQTDDISDSGTTVQSSFDETYTGFSPVDYSPFDVGQYIRIGDEYMKITLILFDTTIRIERGQLGSIVTAHLAGDIIYILGGISISTNNVTLSGTHYKPLLLNIPSIKESMDFENRKYKISNVTLKVSNFEYEGERFSDYAGNLINKTVLISWVSQSESILEVYNGFIRRYSHDDKTVTLSLEDSTQRDLHKDVPLKTLPDTGEILDKYKLKPVPMVYGYVDKSPIVIGVSNIGIIDDKDIFGITNEQNNTFGVLPSLYTNDSDIYLSIPETIDFRMLYWGEEDENVWYGEVDSDPLGQLQWEYDGERSILFKNTPLLRGGFLQTYSIFKPSNISLQAQGEYSVNNGDDETLFNDNFSENEIRILTDNDYLIHIQEQGYSSSEDFTVPFLESHYVVTSKTSLIINSNRSVGSKEQMSVAVSINGTILPFPNVAIFPYGNNNIPLVITDPSTIHYPDGSVYGDSVLVDGAIPESFIWKNVNEDIVNDNTGEESGQYNDLVAFNLNALGGTGDDYDDYPDEISTVPFHIDNHTAWSTTDPEEGLEIKWSMAFVVFQGTRNEMRIHLIHRTRGKHMLAGGNAYFSASHDINLYLKEVDCKSAIDITNPFGKYFYVSVIGRVNDFYE